MAINWALHLRLAGVAPGPLLGLMGDVNAEGLRRVASTGVTAFLAEPGETADERKGRHEMDAQGGRWAMAREVMQAAVEAGVSLLLSDNDVIWLRFHRSLIGPTIWHQTALRATHTMGKLKILANTQI
eukprot:scaffold15271_cov24-Prasinocladus_malaysianus.AAC.1